jgi:hypothetical protein
MNTAFALRRPITLSKKAISALFYFEERIYLEVQINSDVPINKARRNRCVTDRQYTITGSRQISDLRAAYGAFNLLGRMSSLTVLVAALLRPVSDAQCHALHCPPTIHL